jgi:hypothetical protein
MTQFAIAQKLFRGDMPRIPSECGEFMLGLIHRCWSPEPEDRPSMDEMLNEFRSNDFALIPGAISGIVREYVLGVIAWEASLCKG